MKSIHYQENIVIAGLVGATLLSGIVLSNRSASADVVDTISITVPSACSIRSTIATGSEHSKEISNGTYQENIGETAVKAICNDNEGFSIYAIGFTDDEYGKTVLSSSIDATHDIITGTATGPVSGVDTSNWAMKLTAVDGANTPTILSNKDGSFGSYHKVPQIYAKVATYLSNTDSIDGSSFKTTYATYISKTQIADTYHGQVKYTMVHPFIRRASSYTPVYIPCEPGNICYYPNANDHEGSMGQQTTDDSNASLVDGATVTLLASNFSREGYGFAGWSDSPTYEGHFYGPNETITAPVGVTENGLSLYAIWVEPVGYLQNYAKVASTCNTLTTAPIDGSAGLSSVSAFTDQRDGQTYAVARLADGNCWMIENLRLDDTAELTMTNTNNPLNDGVNVTLKHNYTDTETYNTLSPTSNLAYNADSAQGGWCTVYSASCLNQSRLRTDNTTKRATNNPATNYGSMYSYGNYYNWYSATAGNGTSDTTGGHVGGDICPNGWKLPYGGSENISGSFSYLNYKMNNDSNTTGPVSSNMFRSFPTNILYAGYVSGISLSHRGGGGFYWSSTAYSAYDAYRLSLDSSSVYPGATYSSKHDGRAVRCLFNH